MPLPTAQAPAEQALPAPCLRRLAGLRLSPTASFQAVQPGSADALGPLASSLQGSLGPSLVGYFRRNGDLDGLGEVQHGSSRYPLWAQHPLHCHRRPT